MPVARTNHDEAAWLKDGSLSVDFMDARAILYPKHFCEIVSVDPTRVASPHVPTDGMKCGAPGDDTVPMYDSHRVIIRKYFVE